MSYEGRKMTGGYYVIVDEIADAVANTGISEQMEVVLINTCFRHEPGGKTAQKKLEEWCGLHGFAFSRFNGKDAEGKGVRFIRFSRQV